jgi:molybdenum cofactor biosynthesis enzyme MoaA
MKTVMIGDQELHIKDYYCANDGDYISREDGKLWLYVNLTDICNGSCPFCINPAVGHSAGVLDPKRFRDVLIQIRENIYGVSITGGEPFLFPDLIDDVISTVHEVCGSSVEKDIVTNGTHFREVMSRIELRHLDSVHVSRHMIADPDNDRIFGFSTAASEDISEVIQQLEDPALIVLNCVVMSGGVDGAREMAHFLEFAAGLGVRNVSFIGLSRHNTFCSEHYIDPGQIDLSPDPRFHIWNRYCDHNYCSCSSGSFDAESGSIRFYFRSVGAEKAPYARQLVYTADNRLLAGFGGNEIRFG